MTLSERAPEYAADWALVDDLFAPGDPAKAYAVGDIISFRKHVTADLRTALEGVLAFDWELSRVDHLQERQTAALDHARAVLAGTAPSAPHKTAVAQKEP